LFKENEYDPLTGEYTTEAPEVTRRLVEPNTNYWLWVAAFNMSDEAALPQAYKVSICGDTFAF
jgi:hypothetical protein